MLNTSTMVASLSIDKLNKYRNNIMTVISQDKVTLRELKSIIGMLQFATTVVKPGRPFLRRLYDLTVHVYKPHHYVRITQQVKQDLALWLSFLNNYHGKTIISPQIITVSATAHLYSDASKKAFRATYGTNWIQGRWPSDWQQQDIIVLELYPIFIVLSVYKFKLTNAHIVFH